MSKKSRRKASLGKANDESTRTGHASAPDAPADPSRSVLPRSPATGVRGFLARLVRNRKFWLLMVGLIAWGGYLIYYSQSSQSRNRPGYLEFSSEEPDAQVILEKDGVETPLERTEKMTKMLPPGYYTVHLAVPNDLLKLSVTFTNLDPDGRSFVKVQKVTPGFLEFSSEAPDAQVILVRDKDGVEIPLDRTEKLTKPLAPGKYTPHLAVPNDKVKLQPAWFNLDPNGRAFVKVRKLDS